MITRGSLLALSLLGACSPQVPEGQLVCADESECPPTWSCIEGLCYSRALDAGSRMDAGEGDAGRDAGELADAAADADSRDAGPFVPTPGASIATGEVHGCARDDEGSAWCWGGNVYGQIGDGSTAARHAATRVLALAGVLEVAVRGFLMHESGHSCARRMDGTVWCWGRNDRGQLGDGTLIDRNAPVQVGGVDDAAGIAVGRHHSCVRRADRSVACWGRDEHGQLGNGAAGDSTSPSPVVDLTDAEAIAAGGLHTCALRAGGTVVCWGYNVAGQLGDASTASRGTPVEVSGVTNAVGLSAGPDASTCAVLATGRVHCWGWNADGQLGDRTTDSRSIPVEVEGVTDAVEVAVGSSHTCVRHTGGSVSCWGRNDAGQLGDGSTSASLAPVAVMGLGDAEEIAAGYDFTCARRATGAVACWGRNESGRLGDGTTTDRGVPTPVVGLP